MKFAKGHGTQNDFVLLLDIPADVELSASAVAALCDRRRGLGADGVLRVTRAGSAAAAGVLDGLPAGVAADDWFMDYRNADGSVAEMCGNGVRVFAHYLRATGLEPAGEFVVGTVAGARPVVVHRHDAVNADVTVDMGKANSFGIAAATVGGRRFTGLAVDVGNPHLACVDPTLTAAELAALDVAAPVDFDAALFPDGVNVEVLTAPVDSVVDRPLPRGTTPLVEPVDSVVDRPLPRGTTPLVEPVDAAVQMRVHERGVGETRSCGTGTVAAAVAALRHLDADTGTVRVAVPGGEVVVTITDASSFLRGPSVLLAHGELAPAWWSAQT